MDFGEVRFVSVGDIARVLRVKRQQVQYALLVGRIEPVGRAGRTQIFLPEAIGAVRKVFEVRRRRERKAAKARACKNARQQLSAPTQERTR